MVTTVHVPDDARIRSKLIPTLAQEWDVTYATRRPGPSDAEGLVWMPLGGSRLRRWWKASRLMQSKRWDLVAVHDPELLLPAVLRGVSGRPTLFDVHENVPGQIRTKGWVPVLLRRPLAWLAERLLRVAERRMAITLAEEGYSGLFTRPHPVLANYLPATLPPVADTTEPPFLAYLGDITEQRGALLALEAAAGAEMSLVMVGRVSPPELTTSLRRRALQRGVNLELTGPLPHGEALARIGGATAGLAPLLDIPNYRESLPTKVLEYLALGMPVLAADLPGTRSATAELSGLRFVTPGDADAWRREGAAFAADLPRRGEARAQAAEVRARYAWPADEVLTAYRRAARR